MIYRVRCGAHITIYEGEVISVCADSIDEAKEMAEEGFREIMDEKYSWVDIDEVNFEEIVEVD